jgi:uncharacterized SAM-binding protein YcdF (DUF218 family)
MMHRDPNLPAQPESAARLKGRFRTTLWIVVVIACALILFLRFGGDILVHTDPLPRHADVAVVLNGSALGVRARTQGAVQLLKQGIVDYVMASVPPTTYWGESVPQVAHHYFAEHFGPQVADRVVFCVANTNSTIQEAGALRQCLESRGWRQVIVVTSIIIHAGRAASGGLHWPTRILPSKSIWRALRMDHSRQEAGGDNENT